MRGGEKDGINRKRERGIGETDERDIKGDTAGKIQRGRGRGKSQRGIKR